MGRDATRRDSRASELSMLTAHDIYLFREGTHGRLYQGMGCHLVGNGGGEGGASGASFAVWAPNAARISVVGEFNGWESTAHPMQARADGSGVWERFVTGVEHGQNYKYRVVSAHGASAVDKADPYAFFTEVAPSTASRVWALDYNWKDGAWMKTRTRRHALDAPMSIYEVHLGSWRRGGDNRLPTYRDIALELAGYVRDMGFTHVELMPVTEHPFYGSWGYQTTGYFAATSRYGAPQDLMHLIEVLHQHDIGVILDWVPSHFPADAHGLAVFDGTHLYEHADPRQGFHPEWNSSIFNYGRNEVRSFLLSSAFFWLDKYHIDGLRVDAVASMLYLDYGRKDGEWIPNRNGGRENLQAIDFLRLLNESVYRDYPDVQVIAEESTSWPMVSRPVSMGGLGFGMKWNMGWMHDTLDYMRQDPIHRRHHHDRLTFSIWYAFFENFVLPLSHDEVVYGKGSLIGKMPGDSWQQFANLRLLFGYMWAHPGKKLLFMGGEFGQRREWTHESGLEWWVSTLFEHAGVQRWVRDLNGALRTEPALYQLDFDQAGFEWIDGGDAAASVLTFLRKPKNGVAPLLAVCNFTPLVRHNYSVGVPQGGLWRELLNSDAGVYGGSGVGNFGAVEAAPVPAQGRAHALTLTLPPLGCLLLKPDRSAGRAK
ncbi:MAG: 1,4-alpha-glucan branching protein GlgB [Betaproteobacteria bacterium]|nr:MAG: 1,4-alpha-glucan branching protein GlgB [Betaproteobacteria bacterium]